MVAGRIAHVVFSRDGVSSGEVERFDPAGRVCESLRATEGFSRRTLFSERPIRAVRRARRTGFSAVGESTTLVISLNALANHRDWLISHIAPAHSADVLRSSFLVAVQ